MSIRILAYSMVFAILATSVALAGQDQGRPKALWKYPKDHPQYIIVYTQTDMMRLREQMLAEELQKGNYVKKKQTGPNHQKSYPIKPI